MGVDFRRIAAYKHFPCGMAYRGFIRFRARIAASIGVNLAVMEGFTDPHEARIPWPGGLDANDPIIDLLNHSDCDGIINLNRCGPLAKRLREIVSAWPDTCPEDPDGFYKQRGLALADAMQECYDECSDLEFC